MTSDRRGEQQSLKRCAEIIIDLAHHMRDGEHVGAADEVIRRAVAVRLQVIGTWAPR